MSAKDQKGHATYLRMLGESAPVEEGEQGIEPASGGEVDESEVPADFPEFGTVDEAVDALMAVVEEAYETHPVLRMEAYTAEDTAALRSLLSKRLTEAGLRKGSVFKQLKFVHGALKRVATHLSSRATRMKARKYRRLHKAMIRKLGKSFRRTHRVQLKRRALKRASFLKAHPGMRPRHESVSTAAGLQALLENTAPSVRRVSDLHQALSEGYALLEDIGALLQYFFETYGYPEDRGYVAVMESLQKKAGANCGLMESGASDATKELSGFFNQIVVLEKTLRVVDEYVPLKVWDTSLEVGN